MRNIRTRSCLAGLTKKTEEFTKKTKTVQEAKIFKKSRESFDIDEFAMEIEDSTSGSDDDDL